jgi:hypothetical protein
VAMIRALTAQSKNFATVRGDNFGEQLWEYATPSKMLKLDFDS